MVVPQSVQQPGRRLSSSTGPPCCPIGALAALLPGVTAAILLLQRVSRTVEHVLGPEVLSGMGSLQLPHIGALAALLSGANTHSHFFREWAEL